VWLECLGEYLREFAYMASCATLDFAIVAANESFNLNWSGFNDSLFEYVN